jgi:phosphoribosylformylglycinamidine synthase subunit PurS
MTEKKGSEMRIQVLVRLKPGVLDVQGKAVENGLKENGFPEISNVRIGRVIELSVGGGSAEDARKIVDECCQKLLANPIIESYEIKVP